MLLIMNWLLLRLRIDRLTRKSTRDPPTMIDEGNSRRKRKRTGFICELAPNFPQFTIKLVRWKHGSSHAFTHLVWVRLSTPTDVRMIVKFSRHQYRGVYKLWSACFIRRDDRTSFPSQSWVRNVFLSRNLVSTIHSDAGYIRLGFVESITQVTLCKTSLQENN